MPQPVADLAQEWMRVFLSVSVGRPSTMAAAISRARRRLSVGDDL